jgi:excinuclease ABC subunit B
MLGRGDSSGGGGTAPVPGSDRRSRRHDRARSELAGMPKADISRLISALEEEMRDASADLRFEYAARLRDEVADLKKELKALTEMGVPVS